MDTTKIVTEATLDSVPLILGNMALGASLSFVELGLPVTRIRINMGGEASLLSLNVNAMEGFYVNWGDGYSEYIASEVVKLEHSYNSHDFEGWVSIYGNFNGFENSVESQNFKVVKDIELGWNVKELSAKAFYKMAGLETVKFPLTFKEFKGHANFYKCTSLKEVVFPDSLVALEPEETYHEGNFEGCTSLISIHLPESLKFIGDRCFLDCYNLKTVNFPGSLTNIYSSAFSGCATLDKVEFGNNLERIQSYAFYNANNIRLKDIPKSVSEIGNYAFYGTGLRVLNLYPETPPTIYENSLPNLERVVVRQNYSIVYSGSEWSRYAIVQQVM